MLSIALDSLATSHLPGAQSPGSATCKKVEEVISPVPSIWDGMRLLITDCGTRLTSLLLAAESGTFFMRGVVSGGAALGLSKRVFILRDLNNKKINQGAVDQIIGQLVSNLIKNIALGALTATFAFDTRPDLVNFNGPILMAAALVVGVKEMLAFRNL